MTGLGEMVSWVLAPLPMLAILLDIGSWWIARFSEPFIYVIAGRGRGSASYALERRFAVQHRSRLTEGCDVPIVLD